MEDATRPKGVPELVARIVCVRADGSIEITQLVSDRAPDLATVDRVARMVLAARRANGWVRLEEVCPILGGLLELTGLLEPVERSRVDYSDDSRSLRASYLRTGAKPMPTVNPTVQISQIHTVGVPVADQDRALRFYVETLGFTPHRDVPMGPGRRWIEVAPTDGSTTIALVLSSQDVPTGVETGIRLVSADVAGAHAALVMQGVDVDDILRWEGVPPMFAFRDPDGNGLELVEAA